MNKLNQWLSLLANVGVVGGLIFLAVELNQNTQATISAASLDTTNQALSFFSLGIDSQVIPRAQYKRSLGEELDGFELAQLRRYEFYNFRIFESAYMQHRRGYLEEAEWRKYRRIIAARFSRDDLAIEMWRESRAMWTVEFQDEIENIVSTEDVVDANDFLAQ